jgi:hypothetical protein
MYFYWACACTTVPRLLRGKLVDEHIFSRPTHLKKNCIEKCLTVRLCKVAQSLDVILDVTKHKKVK